MEINRERSRSSRLGWKRPRGIGQRVEVVAEASTMLLVKVQPIDTWRSMRGGCFPSTTRRAPRSGELVRDDRGKIGRARTWIVDCESPCYADIGINMTSPVWQRRSRKLTIFVQPLERFVSLWERALVYSIVSRRRQSTLDENTLNAIAVGLS